jgi:ABC-type Na+ efflux pump permease subunit
MVLELEKGLKLLFQKNWSKLLFIPFLCFLRSSFAFVAPRTFVALQFAHPMTQKSLYLAKELGKYWKVFSDERFYPTYY